MKQKTISKLFTESKEFGTYRWESNVENAIEETIKILVKNPEIFHGEFNPLFPLTDSEKITKLISIVKTKIVKGDY